jgi:hypothetical protein
MTHLIVIFDTFFHSLKRTQIQKVIAFHIESID